MTPWSLHQGAAECTPSRAQLKIQLTLPAAAYLMGKRARLVPEATRQARAAARQAIGPLGKRRVAPKTFKRYLAAASLFQLWIFQLGLELAANLTDMDTQLCSYLEHLWAEGETRSLAGDTLSGVMFFLHAKRVFAGAWGLHATWGATRGTYTSAAAASKHHVGPVWCAAAA